MSTEKGKGLVCILADMVAKPKQEEPTGFWVGTCDKCSNELRIKQVLTPTSKRCRRGLLGWRTCTGIINFVREEPPNETC